MNFNISPYINYPSLQEINSINSDFMVISINNNIKTSRKANLKPNNFHSFEKMLDFSSHLKLLQEHKSLDKKSSEQHMKTIEEIHSLENTIISNISHENSNIFTLGRPCEEGTNNNIDMKVLLEENTQLKNKLEGALGKIKELIDENDRQNLIIQKLYDENLRTKECVKLKEKEYNVLKFKYESLKNEYISLKKEVNQNKIENVALKRETKESANFSNIHFFLEKTSSKIQLNAEQTPLEPIKNTEIFMPSTLKKDKDENQKITTVKNPLSAIEIKKCENTMKKTKIPCDYFHKNKENLLKNDKMIMMEMRNKCIKFK